jgi:hypothetical protein
MRREEIGMIFRKSIQMRLVALMAVVLAAAACNMPGPKLGGPQPPADAPTPSDAALESFNDKWRDLNLATPYGPFSITFTEAELTSAFDEAITQSEANGNEIPISDPRVVLRDGLFYVYAVLDLDVTKTSGLITARPSIGTDGLVELTVESIEFGPVDVDPSMLDDLAEQIARSINEPIQASPFDITLNQVTSENGELTITGTIAQ